VKIWENRTYRFALLFGLFLLAIALSYPALRLRLDAAFRALEVVTAHVVAALLGLFSDRVVLRGSAVVALGNFSVTVIDECAGVYEILIFSAAVLAYPATWGQSLMGLALGIPLLYAMNVVRIAGLLVVGAWHEPAFAFMHVYFWQVTMLVMIASTWLAWLLWVVRGDEAPAPAG
jgi:exosortase H (IPTLxxWG-CTERM-specific)